jgi:uncharacterized membrane protein
VTVARPLERLPLEPLAPPRHSHVSPERRATNGRLAPVRVEAGVERVGWSLVALVVVFWGLALWNGTSVAAWFNLAGVALVFAGLAAIWRVWAAAEPPKRYEQGSLMVLAAAGFLVWGYLQALLAPGYGTDSVAFNQYAAELFLDGRNPYEESMLPALDRFLVPTIYHTYLLDGTPVESLSYPALSFLLYVPALALGLSMQSAIFTDLAGWAIACLLLWRLLPRWGAWAAALIMSFAVYTSFVAGGVTDALFLPFVLLAVWQWDRYGDRSELGPSRWLGPFALGLAMAIKQLPWFLFPFLLVGIAWEARGRGQGCVRLPLKYAAVALAVFAGVNAPYIVASPSAWLEGVLTPLVNATVPGGQGLVNLPLFQHVGGELRHFTILGGIALIGAIALLALYYPRFKRAWVPLVGLVFFWPTRSFASYLVDLVPAALLAGATVRPALDRVPRLLAGARKPVLVGIGCAFAVFAALALTAKPPLDISIVSTRSTGQLGSVSRIDVRVRNTSDAPVRPHFSVSTAGRLTTFWYPLAGTQAAETPLVPPGATRTIALRAPNAESMPSLNGGFAVMAFTDEPATVSASGLVPPTPWRLVLLPRAITRPVQVGTPVALELKLIDRLGRSVHRAGVRVALGQVVYNQEALLPGETTINGRPIGQTPVTETTDARGRARFVVSGVQAQTDPVFFQAWIAPPGETPQGYSNLLSIQFAERTVVD